MAKKEYADNGANDLGMISDYRKKKAYTGREDTSVSGRAAFDEYLAAAEKKGATNWTPPTDLVEYEKGHLPVSKSGAEAAQAKQREVMSERRRETKDTVPEERLKKGGSVKSSASKRADGCCAKGKTKGRMV
jgi:hypothetical protein